MFTLDEKIILINLVDAALTLEDSNLRNLKAVKFSSNSKTLKTIAKVNNLRLVKAKLEQLK